jgi:excisionase family DNA binding protein
MSSTVVSPPADLGALAEFEEVVANASPTSDIREAFTHAVHALANGLVVRIESMPRMLSTSQAAEILNISRTTLVKLLEDGKLPYEQPNVHRMVRLGDVLEYKKQRTVKRRAFLRDLTQETMEDGSFFMTAEQADEAAARLKDK